MSDDRGVRLCGSLIFVVQALAFQPPPAAGVIEGRVIDAATGEGIRKANVTLMQIPIVMGIRPGGLPMSDDFYDPTQMPATRVTNAPPTTLVTDEEGGFRASVQPGRYQVHADRNGYLPVPAGVTYLSLIPGETLTGVTIKLNRHAIVAGRVLDGEGEPLANARVLGLKWSMTGQHGQRVLMQQSSTNTNDRGEYRLFGLPPGKYVVAAEWGGTTLFAPGVLDLTEAESVELSPGSQRQGADVRMRRVPVVTVGGKVTGASTSASVSLVGSDPALLMAMARHYSTPVRADGSFLVPNVPPGQYILRAVDNQTRSSARMNLDVDAQNVADLTLALQPGVGLKGQLISEDAPTLAGVTLYLQPVEAGLSGAANSRTNAEGGFRLGPVEPGTYRLQAYGLPAGYYVKSITLGGAAADPVALRVAESAELVVTLEDGTGEISGKVFEHNTRPASDVQVMAVNARGETVRGATSLIDGQFRLAELPPGEYRIFAVVDADINDPATYDRLLAKALKVTLPKASREMVHLTVGAAKQ